MHQSDFVAQQENMKFAVTILILVFFWQFCDAKEVTKKMKRKLKEIKTKYASIKLSMGMYIVYVEASLCSWLVYKLTSSPFSLQTNQLA